LKYVPFDRVLIIIIPTADSSTVTLLQLFPIFDLALR